MDGIERPDVAEAAARMKWTLGGKREIRKLGEHLDADEVVQEMAQGTYGGGQGLLALTDRRLLFVRDALTRKTSEDFPLGVVSSVAWNAGLTQGTIVISASGARSEIKNVTKDDGKRIVDAARGRLGAGATSVQAPAPTSASVAGIPEQIRQLSELHTAGVLTNEEFAAKKAELLSRM